MKRQGRRTAPLWFSALLILGGAGFFFAPGLLSVSETLATHGGDCSPQTSAPAAADTEAAASLADAIWADPDQATCILATHSMTPGDLEGLMSEIAADPDLAERYARARRLGRRL